MKKDAFIRKMANGLLDLQRSGRHTVFFNFSGHVDMLPIKIYRGKWREGKKPCYNRWLVFKDDRISDYMDGKNKTLDWREALGEIELLKTCKPKDKPVSVEKHLPFFRGCLNFH